MRGKERKKKRNILGKSQRNEQQISKHTKTGVQFCHRISVIIFLSLVLIIQSSKV